VRVRVRVKYYNTKRLHALKAIELNSRPPNPNANTKSKPKLNPNPNPNPRSFSSSTKRFRALKAVGLNTHFTMSPIDHDTRERFLEPESGKPKPNL
jgi:hypothetical protein